MARKSYTNEFIAAVKERFPGHKRLHDALDKGRKVTAGYFLLTPYEILDIFKNGLNSERNEQIYDAAETAVEVDKMYRELVLKKDPDANKQRP